MPQSSLFASETEVLTGINTNTGDDDFFQLAIITIKYDESDPKSLKKSKNKVSQNNNANTAPVQNTELPFFQGELGLTNLSRGIFAKFPTVKYRDDDLDIPTFQRRGLHIDKGD